MAVKYYDLKTGLGNVGSYQASARPFLSSSIPVSGSLDVISVNFPTVSRFVTIKNIGIEGATDCQMRVGFSENGINADNYFLLNNEESYSGDWRVRTVYLRTDTNSILNATASIIAGLTSIDANDLSHNWSGSEGIG